MAALWEHPETETEAVHLAIALAYHGLLRVPSRAETSDMTPSMIPSVFFVCLIHLDQSFPVSPVSACAQLAYLNMALRTTVRENRC